MKIIEKLKKVWYYLIAREKETKKKKERKDREDDVMNAITLSNYIINNFKKQGATITNLKLQKVLYYVQGYSLKLFGKPAFQEEIYCWPYGPVVPTSYYEYNRSGAHQLEPTGFGGVYLDRQQETLFKSVIDACVPIPSSVLVDMTHSEHPWKYTAIGEVISKERVASYFNNNNPLELKI